MIDNVKIFQKWFDKFYPRYLRSRPEDDEHLLDEAVMEIHDFLNDYNADMGN